MNNSWKEAVVEQLVSIGIYNPSHDDDPVKAVANLLDWEIQTALDPKVSTPAQELYTQGVVDATMGIANQLDYQIKCLQELVTHLRKSVQ
jgi:hypothetical protein